MPYQPQLTSVLSFGHRLTGVLLSPALMAVYFGCFSPVVTGCLATLNIALPAEEGIVDVCSRNRACRTRASNHDPYGAPLIEAAKLLSRAEVNLVVVCHSSKALAGVITRTDVVRQISQCAGSSCTTAVSALMTRNVTCCRPEDLLSDVWSIMKERELKHIPIVDESARPLGVLYARDALQVLLREVEYEELLLRDYVMGIGYR